MLGLVIRHVAFEGYKYIRRSGNIVCVFSVKWTSILGLAIILMAHTIYITRVGFWFYTAVYIYFHLNPRSRRCDPRDYFTVEVLVVKYFTLLAIYIHIYIHIYMYIYI